MPQETSRVVIDGEVYRVDLNSYVQAEAEPFAPVIREGHPSGETLQDESQVGWRDWSGGAFGARYDPQQPDRYASAENLWALTPGHLRLGPKRQSTSGIAAAVTRLVTPDAAGRVVALTATDVFYRDSGADTFTSVLGSVTPTDIIEFDGNYFVGMGSSTAYQYKSALSATGWTTSNLGGTGDKAYANLFAADMKGTGSGAGNLWKSVNPNKVYSTADPLNTSGTWSSSYLVGSSKFSINSLAVFDNRLIVGKPEGIFWLKPDGTVEPLFSFRGGIHADNGKLLIQSHTGVLFTNWMHGLLAFRPGATAATVTVNEVWQRAAVGTRQQSSAVRGRFVAAAVGPTMTYFTLYDAIDSTYHLVAWDGTGLERGWHPIHTFAADASVLGFEQPSSGNPRLYAKNGSGSPVYFILPEGTDDPSNDPDFQYETEGSFTFSEYESPLAEMEKVFLAVDIRVENLAASRTVAVLYSVDGDPFTSLGSLNSDGSQRIYFGSNVTGRRMQLRLDYTTDGATESPDVRAVYLSYQLTPQSRWAWSMNLLTAGEERPADAIWSDLVADKAQVSGVAYTDLGSTGSSGNAFTVLVKSLKKTPQQARNGGPLDWVIATQLLQQIGVTATVAVRPLSVASLSTLARLVALDNNVVAGARPPIGNLTGGLTRGLLLQREV